MNLPKYTHWSENIPILVDCKSYEDFVRFADVNAGV